MKKNITGSSFVLCGALFLAAAFPVVTWGDPPKDDPNAFYNQVNALYYNYTKQGLKKYKCEVRLDVFDKYKVRLSNQYKPGDAHLKSLQKVQFFLSYDPTAGMVFTSKGLQPSGDADFDKQADTVVKGLLNLGSKYLDDYKDLVYAPFFELEKFDMQMEKTKDGYRVTEIRKDKKDKGTIYLSDKYVAVKFEGDPTNQVVVAAVPGFFQTPQGLLLNSQMVSIKGGGASMDQQINMEYQPVKNLEMLSTLKTIMHIVTKEGQQQDIDLNFTFTNYEIN